MLLFFVFSLITYECFCQVISTARRQPDFLEISQISNCCVFQNEELNLLECANKSVNTRKLEGNEVVFVTYASPGKGYFGVPDIVKYSSYMLAVMGAYCEHNKYYFRLMGPDTGTKIHMNYIFYHFMDII